MSRIERVTYQRIYLLGATYVNEKIGADVLLEDGDIMEDEVKSVHARLEKLHIDLNPQLYTGGVHLLQPNEPLPVIPKENLQQDEETNKEFEKVKRKVSTFKYCEDALAYLIEKGFQYNIECKNIINNLPSKNKTK